MAGIQHRAALRFPAKLLQRQQVSGEIAAVDGGHVARREGRQGPGVVPVQQVPPKAFQLVERTQRGPDAVERLGETQPAKIPRRAHGQQVETDVGRRRPVRDDRVGLFLEIVRWQVLLARRHERGEEVPRASRDVPQLPHVGRAQAVGVGLQEARQAQAARHQRRQPPEQQPGSGGPQPLRIGPHHRGRPRDDHDSGALQGPDEHGQRVVGGGLHLRRRNPLEQQALRQQAEQRPRDGVQGEPGVLGQQGH